MLILTNFARFPSRWRSSTGVEGEALVVNSLGEFLRNSRRASLVIVNCNVGLLLALRGIYMLLPFLRRPILGHDIVLRTPTTFKSRLLQPLKRFLLSRVDHYSLHFRDLTGYTRYFGIRPEIASYVPFKASVKDRDSFAVNSDGEFVVCLGWSERDYDTFFDAMEKLPYPGAIPKPRFDLLQQHCSRFTRPLSAIPANVQLLDDDLSTQSMVRIIERAKVVVLPTISARINASGIGTYLNAMFMGKCVITSHGPGSTDVLTGGEAILVPPEDSTALADAIRRVWEDPALRERTAQAGLHYAAGFGGEPELRQRVLEIAVQRFALRS